MMASLAVVRRLFLSTFSARYMSSCDSDSTAGKAGGISGEASGDMGDHEVAQDERYFRGFSRPD